ncbi:hypothetical protein B0H19DRAFT_1264852 [Mycena capillaripes]|nr:hypothetical protein B0H19DRAFT_1264852 [Mycena capillaripes]
MSPVHRHLDVKSNMQTFALLALLFSPLRVIALPSPDSPVTLLAVPEFEGFEGINSIVAIGTAPAGDVTTYELFRTTGPGGFTDPATETLIESSGGYTLNFAPVFTDHFESGTASLRTDILGDVCAFVGGGQASCDLAGTPTTLALEALATFGAVSSPASPAPATGVTSAADASRTTGVTSSADPSRTTGVASSADPSSTSNSNAAGVRYGKGRGFGALLSVGAAVWVIC